MPSRVAASPGSKSTAPTTTGGRAATCCRPSRRSASHGRVRPHVQRRRFISGEPRIMYERFFDLRERPFSLSPDPNYLYPSRKHSEALSYIRYGIEGHAGFVVITGEVGCGKTTLLQTAVR